MNAAALAGPPLRILLLTTGLRLGGAEQQVAALASRFAELGHAVLVLSLTAGCEVALPNEVLTVTLGMSKAPWSLAAALLRARRLIRQWRPDVMHSHMVHANLFARTLVALGGMPPLICTAHSVREGGKARMLAYRWTDRLAVLTTHVSTEGRQRMIAMGAVPPERIAVVPNGIDTQRFCPDPAWRAATRAALGIAPEQRLVLHVGRLVPEKNQALLLGAFARLLDLSGFDPGIQLRIAGDGPLRAALATRIASFGLTRHVRLLGTRADVPWLLNAADLFVLSSDIEGMPLVVGEALACGCPVVATDAAGVADMVGPHGHIVPRGDAAALARAMLHALQAGRGGPEDEAARHRHIDATLGLDAVGAQWLACYGRLAGTRHARTELA